MTDYDALMQEDEDEATLDCGCVLSRGPFHDGSISLTFCEQHRKASEPMSFEDACHIVFNHPDYVIGNLLSKQHLEDADYDTSQIPNKIDEWAAESIAEVMWDIVSAEVPMKGDA